jgi:hypothetical protein
MRIPRMRPFVACSVLLPAVWLLAGCDRVDPYTRPGEWRPLGANAANLRAMGADPRDLDEGQPVTASPGDLAAAAVARLRTDTAKRLPDSSISSVQVSGTGSDQGSTGGAAAAAPVAAAAAGGS